MFTTALAVLLLPALAAAQYGAPDPTPTASSPTSSTAAPVPSAPADTPGNMNVGLNPCQTLICLHYIQIDVAPNGSFSFHPNNIKAPKGTLVTFWIPE